MVTMIERVARAMAAAFVDDELDNIEINPAWYADDNWQDFTYQASAAIEAMREPTDRMVRDGIFSYNTLESMPHITHEESCKNIWSAMITAALAE